VADVTVVIPHIPVRPNELMRAIRSVVSQTLQPASVIIIVDDWHNGATFTRNIGLQKVTTEWVAFLDDDDELRPNHLEELRRAAYEQDADVVYAGYDVIGGYDPMDRFGQPFDPDVLRDHSFIPVTSLVRTALAHKVGGFVKRGDSPYEDWGFYLALLDAGARFYHHPVKTWKWHHWGVGQPGLPGNTSGMGNRW
jgi:glycosyltransferase involved in cell wall biosynthesis